ncbi:OB-fold nucleic acid binding domain-containing protein [Kitasatospora sp. NPDC058162]|uniref:OB-fold nucleic acid binding domain-containing protein n=1 Tax=Kitasatospora sp. NPDC058162 TaxID=3346362 RepID=UPI0036DA9F5F
MIIAQAVPSAPLPTRPTIAALRTSGRTEGEVRLTGTITQARQHANRAGNEWATLTLTDTTGQIGIRVFPRTWMPLRELPFVEVGRPVAVTGRINAPGHDLVEVYCNDLTPSPARELPPQVTDPMTVQALIGRHARSLADLAGSGERPRTLAAFTVLVRDAAQLLVDTRLGEAGGHLRAAGQYLRAIAAAGGEHQQQLLEFAAAHLAQAQDLADAPTIRFRPRRSTKP